MTGPGRPIGPEGKLDRVQISISEPIADHLDAHGRGRSRSLRHAYYRQMAHEVVMEFHGPHPYRATPEENLTALQIVHDLGNADFWSCYTPYQQFQVVIYDPEVFDGHLHDDAPIYDAVGSQVYARTQVPERLRDQVSASYIVTHELVNPYRSDVDRHDAYLAAVRRIHANPDAVRP